MTDNHFLQCFYDRLKTYLAGAVHFNILHRSHSSAVRLRLWGTVILGGTKIPAKVENSFLGLEEERTIHSSGGTSLRSKYTEGGGLGGHITLGVDLFCDMQESISWL